MLSRTCVKFYFTPSNKKRLEGRSDSFLLSFFSMKFILVFWFCRPKRQKSSNAREKKEKKHQRSTATIGSMMWNLKPSFFRFFVFTRFVLRRVDEYEVQKNTYFLQVGGRCCCIQRGIHNRMASSCSRSAIKSLVAVCIFFYYYYFF